MEKDLRGQLQQSAGCRLLHGFTLGRRHSGKGRVTVTLAAVVGWIVGAFRCRSGRCNKDKRRRARGVIIFLGSNCWI